MIIHFRYIHHNRGVTLLELTVAMAIGLVILGSVYSFFIFQNKTYSKQELITEMQQNARIAMDMITREVRMVGFGMPDANLSGWIDWVPGVTINNHVQITEGGGPAPDTVYLAGCFDQPHACLSAAAAAGATALTVTDADAFNTSSKKLISLNGLESALITNISGNTLTIDTDPATNGNQGLNGAYTANSPVFLGKVITYSIVDNILKRNENLGAGRQPVAENIENIQFAKNIDTVDIDITTKTGQADPDYLDPVHGDSYRRYLVKTKVVPRNIR